MATVKTVRGIDKITMAQLDTLWKNYMASKGTSSGPIMYAGGIRGGERPGDILPNYNPLDVQDFKGVTGDTGKSGRKFETLDPDTQKIIMQTRNADAQTAAIGGSKRGHHTSLLNRVLDVLSRGNYGTAEAMISNEREFRQSRADGQSILGSLKDGLVEGTKGEWRGLSGKKKTFFSEALQQEADMAHAAKEGRDPNHTVAGEGHLNKYVKFGVGLAGDIVLDPTTYVGVGLLGKAAKVVKIAESGKEVKFVLKSADAAKALEDTADVHKLVKKGLHNVDQEILNHVTAVHRTPVAIMSAKDVRNLSPEAKELYKIAKQSQKGKAGIRKGAAETQHLGSKVANGNTVKDILEVLAKGAGDQFVARETAKGLKTIKKFYRSPKEIAKLVEDGHLLEDEARQLAHENGLKLHKIKAAAETAKVAAGLSERELRDTLWAVTTRNMSPEIQKGLKLRIGTKSTIITAPERITHAIQKVGDATHVSQSLRRFSDGFDNAFRAGAGIHPALQFIRNQAQGVGNALVKAHLNDIMSSFKGVDPKDAEGAWRAFREGVTDGHAVEGAVRIDGTPVGNLAEFVSNEMHSIALNIKANNLAPRELGAWLDRVHSPLKGKNAVASAVKKKEVVNRSGNVISTGDVFDPDWFMKWVKNHDGITDPARALFAYHAAVEKALAKREMFRTIGQEFGVPVRKVFHIGNVGQETAANRLGQSIADHSPGWREVNLGDSAKEGAKPLAGFKFHPEIADAIERMDRVFQDAKTTGAVLKQFDAATQGFKSLVTRYNPSFYTRTLMGEMMMGYLGGMRNFVGSYHRASLVMRGRNRSFLGNDPTGELAKHLGSDRNAIGSANMLALGPEGIVQAAKVGEGSKVILKHPRFGNLTADRLWGMYLNSGLKSGFVATDLAKGVQKVGRVRGKVDAFSEVTEDYGRLAHFIDSIQHSKLKTLGDAVEEAGMTVSKYHLDYTQVTKFEKDWATRVIPFYKWLRLSSPLMVDILLSNPGKAMTIPKALRAISGMAGYDPKNFGSFPGGPDALVPDWLANHAAVPIGNWGGNTNYFDPVSTLPFAGSLDLGEGNPIDKVNPLIRAPFEVGLNQTTFGSHPRDSKGDLLNYLASQSPQSSLGNQLVTRKDPDIPVTQSILSFLGNPGVQPNTPKRIKGQAVKEQQAAYAHRRDQKKKKGVAPHATIFVPPEFN